MDNLFESIKNGLIEAVDYSEGKNVKLGVFQPETVNVKSIRQETRLRQDEFASTLGLSVATLRHWERGDSKPHGLALVLLNLVKKGMISAPQELMPK